MASIHYTMILLQRATMLVMMHFLECPTSTAEIPRLSIFNFNKSLLVDLAGNVDLLSNLAQLGNFLHFDELFHM